MVFVGLGCLINRVRACCARPNRCSGVGVLYMNIEE